MSSLLRRRLEHHTREMYKTGVSNRDEKGRCRSMYMAITSFCVEVRVHTSKKPLWPCLVWRRDNSEPTLTCFLGNRIKCLLPDHCGFLPDLAAVKEWE